MHVYVRIYIHTYVHTYIRTYVHTYIRTYVHTYIRTYVHTCIRTYVHTYIRTYVHTCIRTYVHTYIRTYVHTYIRTYVHTYMHWIFHFEQWWTTWTLEYHVFFAWPFFPFKGCASDVRWGLDRGGKADGLKAESHAATRVVHSNSLDSHSSATIDLDDNNETWSFDPSQDRCDFLGNRWDHKRFRFLNLCWKGLRSQLDDAEPLVATRIIRRRWLK